MAPKRALATARHDDEPPVSTARPTGRARREDTINEMIANLRDTTRTNKEQDWLKTNLAKFSGMMQGQRSVESLAQLIMLELTPVVSAHLGTFFVVGGDDDKPVLELLSSYGYTRRKTVSNRFAFGEGLVGQAALEKKTILVTQVPTTTSQSRRASARRPRATSW